ncbi:hypothetical protein [Virgibacillus proomii]|uniref:hypothetical protein n=1 Tax=Virgibacillus proomii TaxID=84407 RepID=UPI001C117D53|nr:hypothetical protein [Virgibacillus proomii]MBU5267708.1 hypothetical protein [Virgibacillus proomii]
MKKYYITFIMNDGSEIAIEEERESKNDFFFSLKRYDSKWYKSSNTIINLDNVNSIVLQSEMEKNQPQKDNEDNSKALRSTVW